MALAIVPCERNLLAPEPRQTDFRSFLSADPCPDTEFDDLHALAAELAAAENLGLVEAISQALALQDALITFAALWDVDVALNHADVRGPTTT